MWPCVVRPRNGTHKKQTSLKLKTRPGQVGHLVGRGPKIKGSIPAVSVSGNERIQQKKWLALISCVHRDHNIQIDRVNMY